MGTMCPVRFEDGTVPETPAPNQVKTAVEECAANIAELNRRVAQAFNRKMPTPKPEDKPKPKSFPDDATLEQLQELLRDRGISLDTTFQGQLNKWLASHEDVVEERDEQGFIYMIERF